MDRKEFVEIMDGIELHEEDKQKILDNCLYGKRTKNKMFLYSKQIAAACVVGAVFLTSATAYAAVNAYQEYMGRMSAKEIESRYAQIQQGEKNADSFSRPLTESERERLKDLTEKYKQGLRFPDESMERVEGIGAVEKEAVTPFYDYIDMIFCLPDRELTDEELLQIIDVWEKGNYSLATVGTQGDSISGKLEDEELTDEELLRQAEDFMAQYKQELAESDEDKVRIFSEKLIQSVPGGKKDVSALTWEIVLYGEENATIWVSAEDDTDKYSIFFTEDSTPEKLRVRRYLHFILNSDPKNEQTEYAAKQYREVLKEVADWMPSIMKETMGIESEVQKAEIYSGNYLVLTDTVGNRYRIAVTPESGELGEFLTYEAGRYDDIDLSGEQIE